MSKRTCFSCGEYIPPETEHFEIENDPYCTDCVEVVPYTGYQYFVNGDFVGDSEEDEGAIFIESYDDEYEE